MRISTDKVGKLQKPRTLIDAISGFMADFLRLIDVNAGDFPAKKGPGNFSTQYILSADDLGNFSGILLETMLEVDDFLGARCRKAMTPQSYGIYNFFPPEGESDLSLLAFSPFHIVKHGLAQRRET